MGIIYRRREDAQGTEYAVNILAFWLGTVILPVLLLASYIMGNRIISLFIFILAALALADTLPFKMHLAIANLSSIQYTKEGSIWSTKKPLTYRFMQ